MKVQIISSPLEPELIDKEVLNRKQKNGSERGERLGEGKKTEEDPKGDQRRRVG
jgi:hypothetical protein